MNKCAGINRRGGDGSHGERFFSPWAFGDCRLKGKRRHRALAIGRIVNQQSSIESLGGIDDHQNLASVDGPDPQESGGAGIG
jgi:hypothetical protein